MDTKRGLDEIRVIIFDWGGTLCRTHRELDAMKSGAERATAYCRDEGLNLPHDAPARLLELFVERMTERGVSPDCRELDTPELLSDWLKAIGTSPFGAASAERLARMFWEPWIGCLDMIDGAAQAMRTLASRHVLGLLSNVAAIPDICVAQLQHLGIFGYLRFAEFSSRLGVRKPRPETYRAVLDHALRNCPGVTPHNVLFVGDDPGNDVAGPAGAGMRTALIDADGAHPPGLEDLHLTRVAELPDCLPARPAGPVDTG